MPDEQAGPVLVTGASSGIGRAIVEHLSASGHSTLAGARKESDLAALRQLPWVTSIRLDVTRSDDVTRAADTVRDSGEGLYGLVNNAGIASLSPLVETSVEELHRVLEVNLDGMHRMVCALFPFLRESKGRIVNMSSVGGILTETFLGPYGISKHAVEAYTEILREEVAAFGVRVSAVEPGAFQSELVANAATLQGDRIRSVWENSIYRDVVLQALDSFTSTPEALHRTGLPKPTAVAEAVAHALFSPEPKARYLVGNQDTCEAVIDKVLTILRELNEQQPHTLTTSQLVARLQKTVG
jgi:NAD(P)-dependent dehydrogenase (short-subunit alcohol dehydrogenase family)